MNTALRNIVSVNDLCPGSINTPSSSGYDIWMASEISYRGIAAITDEKYVRGRNLLLAKRDMAVMEVENDFLKIMSLEGNIMLSNDIMNDAAIFNQSVINPTTNAERGITIHAVKASIIRKVRIKDVYIFPADNVASTKLKIWDNGNLTAYDITLRAGEINKFFIDYIASGDLIRIFIDNSNVRLYSSNIVCMVGCNGTLPNDCGYVKGWNGTQEIRSEGFGISASFNCICDYSSLLTLWSKQYIGEIIFHKMRALVQQEVLNSDRLNNFTIYGREEAKSLYEECENTYREKWNSFALALPKLLNNVKDGCLINRNPKWTTNI